MGIALRHVVWASATLSLGAFLYVLTLEPMDPRENPRASAIDQTPDRTGLIIRFRQSMSNGQLTAANAMTESLMEYYYDDPSTWFYRALISEAMGHDEAAAQAWRRLDAMMQRLIGWKGRYSSEQISYYRAWGSIGVGDIEEGQAQFRELADRVQERLRMSEVEQPGAHYNAACYRAMAGQTEVAMAHWARAVELGYRDSGDEGGWWLVDPDLESLHKLDAFWEIAQPLLEPRSRRDPRDPHEPDDMGTQDEPEIGDTNDPSVVPAEASGG